VEKVEIPLRLRDFQAQWESPAFGLFHGAAFSTAILPINSAIDPYIGSWQIQSYLRFRFGDRHL
jgi:hypothetical protein